MKKLITIVLISSIPFLLLSQSFVEDGKLWNVKECMVWSGCWTNSFKLEGDTTIGQYTYKKYYSTLDTTYSSWNLIGAMREINDSVFMLDFEYEEYEEEMLLYDFNLSVGDIFITNIMGCEIYDEVIEIDTVKLLNGDLRQRIWFYFYHSSWIRGLGCSYGPSLIDPCGADLYYVTTCAYKDGEQYYQDPTYNCFVYTLDVNEKKIENNYTVYPNPFTTSTTIEYHLDHSSEVTLTIFNHLGKQVDIIRQYQQPGKQSITWQPQELPPGLYYFTLHAGDQVATGKMMKVR